MRVTMYMGLSVDGFVARANDAVDFLGDPPAGDEQTPTSFQAFLGTVDVLVMGRRTFEVVRSFGPDAWPYGDTRVVVLSETWTALPDGTRPSVSLRAGSPTEVCTDLEAEGVRHVYVDGARTARTFLAAGRVTDLVLTYVPTLIGEGISAWGSLPRDVSLELVDHVRLGPNVQLHYRVVRAA